MSSLSHCFSLFLFCVLSTFSLPLTSNSSDLSLLFLFFFFSSLSHTLYSLPLTAHGEASLFLRSALGGWASDGWLQIGVGGYRLAWVALDQRGVMGGRGGVDSHGWPWVLLLVSVSSWLEFQKCFNRVSRLLEFQRCFNGVSGWME